MTYIFCSHMLSLKMFWFIQFRNLSFWYPGPQKISQLLIIHFKGCKTPRLVDCPSEVCIQGLSHLQVNDIAAGVTHSCAVTWRFQNFWTTFSWQSSLLLGNLKYVFKLAHVPARLHIAFLCLLECIHTFIIGFNRLNKCR